MRNFTISTTLEYESKFHVDTSIDDLPRYLRERFASVGVSVTPIKHVIFTRRYVDTAEFAIARSGQSLAIDRNERGQTHLWLKRPIEIHHNYQLNREVSILTSADLDVRSFRALWWTPAFRNVARSRGAGAPLVSADECHVPVTVVSERSYFMVPSKNAFETNSYFACDLFVSADRVLGSIDGVPFTTFAEIELEAIGSAPSGRERLEEIASLLVRSGLKIKGQSKLSSVIDAYVRRE